MAFSVALEGMAVADVAAVLQWLTEKSPWGAETWNNALNAALEQLKTQADGYPLLPKSKRLGITLRIALFHTPQGRNYQLLFIIDQAQRHVRVLRVRSPGQRPVRRRDLP
ncbi:MAG: hypothetical protein C0483_20655 [Pirellula sp.]|nr:hypothetical protein [Pirellula sp.]